MCRPTLGARPGGRGQRYTIKYSIRKRPASRDIPDASHCSCRHLCRGRAPAQAQPALPQRSPWLEIPADAVFESRDTWTLQGTRLRLCGVQSCLRQTNFTNEHNLKRGCGEASLAMLIALVRDFKPLCESKATIGGSRTELVFLFCRRALSDATTASFDLGSNSAFVWSAARRRVRRTRHISAKPSSLPCMPRIALAPSCSALRPRDGEP